MKWSLACLTIASLGAPCLAGSDPELRLSFLGQLTVDAEEGQCSDGSVVHVSEPGADPRCLVFEGWAHALAIAAVLAVEHFNTRNDMYIKEFGGLGGCTQKIKLDIYDSGSSPSVTIRNMLKMMPDENTRPHAILGSDSSSSSVPAALISGVYEIPQISYWATSAGLDNTDDYPYFMRTIPTDDAVAFSICKYWIEQGFAYAAMFYENDNYGEAFRTSIETHCYGLGMKKVHTFPVVKNEAQIQARVQEALQTGVRVFFVAVVNDGFASIFKNAIKMGIAGKGSSWMISDGISSGDLDSLTAEEKKFLNGTLRVIASGGVALNPIWSKFRSDWPNFNLTELNEKYFTPMDWTATDAVLNPSIADTIEVKGVGTYLYDSIAALGLYACASSPTTQVQQSEFGPGFYSVKSNKESAFYGLSGKVLFDEIGNRDLSTASYVISNLLMQTTDDTPSGSFVEAGTYDTENQEWKMDKQVYFNEGSGEAVKDMIPPRQDFNFAGQSVKAICRFLFATNILLAGCLTLWTLKNRKHPVIKASQTKFLALISFGVMMSSSSILPLTIDDEGASLEIYNFENNTALEDYGPASTACQAAIWLYSIGFTITYSSLASKVWRIKKIFKNTKLKKVKISNRQLLSLMAACMFVDALLIIIWQQDSPLLFTRRVLTRDSFDNALQSTGQCVSGNSTLYITLLAVFHLSLLIVGNYLSYQCRHVDTAFNEGKYVAVAMVSNLQVLALAVPVLIIVADNPASNMFLRSGVVFLNDISVLMLVFVPKIIAVMTGKGITTVMSSGTTNVHTNHSGMGASTTKAF